MREKHESHLRTLILPFFRSKYIGAFPRYCHVDPCSTKSQTDKTHKHLQSEGTVTMYIQLNISRISMFAVVIMMFIFSESQGRSSLSHLDCNSTMIISNLAVMSIHVHFPEVIHLKTKRYNWVYYYFDDISKIEIEIAILNNHTAYQQWTNISQAFLVKWYHILTYWIFTMIMSFNRLVSNDNVHHKTEVIKKWLSPFNKILWKRCFEGPHCTQWSDDSCNSKLYMSVKRGRAGRALWRGKHHRTWSF